LAAIRKVRNLIFVPSTEGRRLLNDIGSGNGEVGAVVGRWSKAGEARLRERVAREFGLVAATGCWMGKRRDQHIGEWRRSSGRQGPIR